ncbi:MAG: inositol monophosphatase [Chloroflexi bacterium]|nr:inositol monophosphatase [Chloroflexota bacterium]
MALSESQLAELEAAAVEMARHAGRLLLDRFGQPVAVEYKSERNRDPVTAADRESDEYLKQEISRRFPGHGILSEESPDAGDSASDVVWVLDPLDGTTNYLNGMPAFGVSVAVVERGRPVAGAMFVPSIHCPEGSIYHARVGGGAFRDDHPIHVAESTRPANGRLVVLPGYFWRGYLVRRELGRGVGEIRTLGSIVYEMGLVAQGVAQYSLLARPHAWDVAAGVVLVREAGGVVLTRPPGRRAWVEMEAFPLARAADGEWMQSLRRWQRPLIIGNRETAWFVARGIRRRWRLLWRLSRLLGRWMKSPPQQQSESRR